MIEPVMNDETRRQLRERLRFLPMIGDARTRAKRLRAVFEELGIHCDESADLHDLDAVLFASARGSDALIASRLDDDQRLTAYARLAARILACELHPPVDASMEYADDALAPSKREREEERMLMKLAWAIREGRLDLAPRPLYEDVPKLTFAFTPRSAARSTLGGFHWWSGFWYRRSSMYRRWRSRRDVSTAIVRVIGILDPADLQTA
ncbi:MAG: hypothetical protein WEB52_02740 [Dehalococcoidia bacterium]